MTLSTKAVINLINGKYSYHLEAQIEKDDSIVFRVFEYGFGHANRNRMTENGRYVLQFPRPMVIYLYYEGDVANEYTMTLEFNEGKEVYEYRVPVLKLPEISSQELSDRKMVILIPFHVLKLRYDLKQRKFDNLDELQRHILHDIIGHIDNNLQLGNITKEEAMAAKDQHIEELSKEIDMLKKQLQELKTKG